MSMNIKKKLEKDRLNLKRAGFSPMKIKSGDLPSVLSFEPMSYKGIDFFMERC
jgi:hypothetical protein